MASGTKTCTYCHREFPRTKRYFNYYSRSISTGEVRSYPRPQCKWCQRIVENSNRRMNNVIRGRSRMPGGDWELAMKLVAEGKSYRSIEKLTGCNRKILSRRAKETIVLKSRYLRLSPVMEILEEYSWETGRSINDICRGARVDSAYLRRSDKITVEVADKLLTSIGRHYLMPSLEEEEVI